MTAPFEILFPLYPGVTQLDFTGPFEVLMRAPNARVSVASMGAQEIDADGLVFARLKDLAAVERCDLICIPGGFGTTDAILDDAYMAEIRRLGAGAKYLTSVCTGSLILAAAGFLKGRRAACHWAWRELLEPFGAIVDEGRVVRDGNIITGGGVTSGLDFAFTVLAELAGEDYAQMIQLALEYAPQPPFESGRPELAPPHVLEAFRKMVGPRVDRRRAAADIAAARTARRPAAVG